MNDLLHAGTLFLAFSIALVLYGWILAKTGNRNLLPYRAMHSVRDERDVRRVGSIVVRVGLVIGLASVLLIVFAQLNA